MVRNVTSVRRVTLVLPGFGTSCWVGVWLVWLILAFFMLVVPNHNNWLLLLLLTPLAIIIGNSVDRLRSWPAAAIVPGFSVSVFVSCIATFAGVALFTALLVWMRGAVPAIGPALMVGTGTVALVLRFGVRGGWVAFIIVFLGIVWDSRSGYDPSVSAVLAEPLIQVVALALAVIAAVVSLRLLKLPPGAGRLTGGASWELDDTTRTMVFSAIWLGGFVLCRMLEPLSGLLVSICGFYVVGALGPVVDGFLDMHTRLTWNWLPATTRSRDQLGRRCAAGLALRSVAWLPAGTMAVALQAWVGPGEPSWEFPLLVHVAFLLLIAFLAGVVYRRWPPAPLLLLLSGAPAFLFLIFVFGLLSLYEYTPLGHALLVAALIASAWLAVCFGGRGLAKAEVVA